MKKMNFLDGSYLRLSYRGLLILFSLGAGCCLASQERHALVKAKVVEIEDLGAEVAGRMEIIHVYRGNIDTKHFEAISFKELPETFRFNGVIPEFQLGEYGIWELERSREDEWIRSTSKLKFNVPFTINPARKAGDWMSDNYTNVKRIAELSEKVFEGEFHDNREAQFKTLKKLAVGENVVEALWAIVEIDETGFPAMEVELFFGLLMENISNRDIRVQIKLDEILSERDIRGWMRSGKRRKVLNNWIGNLRNYSRQDLSDIKARLRGSFNRGELTKDWLFNFLWRSLEVHEEIKIETEVGD